KRARPGARAPGGRAARRSDRAGHPARKGYGAARDAARRRGGGRREDPMIRGRVLIIDDEANFRDFLGEAIQAEGYQVVLAPTARIGLQRARSAPPDIVLLDQNLPDESGLAILEHLHDLPSAP